MKNKLKYYLVSFLLWKTRRQINVYGVFEEVYNFISAQKDYTNKYLMMWVLFYQLLRYEDKIEKNLGYIEKLQK